MQVPTGNKPNAGPVDDKDRKIDELNGKLVTMHHELSALQDMKTKLADLKRLEEENRL
jgi:hypothetical protein